MNEDSNSTDLVIHLSDGKIARFSQSNDRLTAELLKGIHPDHVFSKKTLLLYAEDSVSVFPTERVARLETNRILSEWTDQPDFIQADQIADYDFQWLRETLGAVQRTVRRQPLGENLILAADLELSNSERIYLRVELAAGTADSNSHEAFLHRVLHSGGLLLRLRGGGYSIVNPACLVRLTLYPVFDATEQNLHKVAAC